MLHFPSTSFQNTGSNGLPKRSDSVRNLNATQQKSSSDPMFLKIEEELHDARRVSQHGQEDDLRMALNMVISRVSELSTLLSEVYKSQAELEVQLNVAKSNLQLVIANNEMLEEALKSGNPKDVGWRRSKESHSSTEHRGNSIDISENGHASPVSTPMSPFTAPNTPPPPQPSDTRFFKFRFNSSASNSKPPSRPQTPTATAINTQQQPHSPKSAQHTSSSSMPSLPAHNKEIEDLLAELEKERAGRKAVLEEKAALEAELESLSQALFEEANKMVAQERIKRAETEEELKEAHQQKQALRDALRIVETEVEHLRTSNSAANSPLTPLDTASRHGFTRSRSSSQVALKSPPRSRTTSASSAVPQPLQTEKESEDGVSEEQDKKDNQDDGEEKEKKEQSGSEHNIITGGAPETLDSPHSPSIPPPSESKFRPQLLEEDPSGPGPITAQLEQDPDVDVENVLPSSSASMALTDTDEPSPWADVPSSSSGHTLPTSSPIIEPDPTLYSTTVYMHR